MKSTFADYAPGAQKLILAAEEIIAHRGMGGASVREILRVAKHANNSAIYHHFGSKDQLIRTVYHIRQSEVDACRLQRIAALDKMPSDMAGLTALFLLPVVDAFQGTRRAIYCQFILHLILHNPFDEAFGTINDVEGAMQVRAALRDACPAMSEGTFTMRLSITAAGFLQGLSYGDRVAVLTGNAYPQSDRYIDDLLAIAITTLSLPGDA